MNRVFTRIRSAAGAADRISGVAAILIGAVVMWLRPPVTDQVQNGDPGPGFFPLIVSSIIMLLGALLVLVPVGSEQELTETGNRETGMAITIAVFVGMTLAYALVFQRIGFTLATFGYLFLSGVLIGPRSMKSLAGALAFAAITTLVAGELFARGFSAFLPGVLTF